jgi:predicted dehydrogenase
VRRVLVVGVGSIGERHLRCFLATGRVRAAVCEANAELAARVAGRYGIGDVFTSLDAALAAGPFDAAVICTPAHLHLAMARRAVGAGCHVLIEKPLSTTADGLPELRAALAESGKVASVAYVYRAHPALGAMRAAIAAGRFGRPVQLVMTGGQHFPTYRPAYRQIYYRDRATGGGAIQDALTHMLDAAQWLVGPVTRLAADAAHQVLDGVTVEDTAHVVARHGGVLASYSLNQYQAPNETTITVVCERGTARFEAHRAAWKWQTDPAGTWEEESHGPLERDTLFVRQAAAFLDAVEGTAPPACPLEEGARALAANRAVQEAADGGRWAEVRPIT